MIPPSSTSMTSYLFTEQSSEISGLKQSEGSAKRSKIKENELIRETENFSADNESESPSDVAPVEIVWKNVILLSSVHICAAYGFYLMFTSAKWQTSLFAIFVGILSGLGVTAGAHRLWCHRSYKAKFPLRLILAFLVTIAVQNDLYEWCRDHRVHHKYSETHADPHNSKRGFFFSHIGWLMCRKHPDVLKKGKLVDCSDLLEDPIVRFHQKYYVVLVLLCAIILPIWIPVYYWNESPTDSLFVALFSRLGAVLNMTWLVNSAAHMWGYRPYDADISPRENILVSLGALGEGFHNYHHVFPYDYATGEYGLKYNLTTAFIDLMAFFGLAYDRKTASRSCVQDRKLRTGGDSSKKVEDNGSVSTKQE